MEPLYTVENKITLEQYKWVNGVSKMLGNILSIIILAIVMLDGLVVCILGNKSYFAIGVLFICLPIFAGIIRFVIVPLNVKKAYKILAENGENIVKYDFYEDHVLRTNGTGTAIIKYSQVTAVRESDKLFAAHIPVNKILILDKSTCDAAVIDYFKSKISPKKKSIIPMIVVIILTIVISFESVHFVLNAESWKNYPFTTYDSFIDCAEAGYVKDVIIREDVVTYVYFGKGEDEYLNTVIQGDVEDLKVILDGADVDWTEE